MNRHYITGHSETPAGRIPRVSTELSFRDILGMLMVRLSISRMRYRVSPGIYAVGDPAAGSNVFVSANYKLSFDTLRKALKGMDAWILVLDTKGINVWCAAGKGTFGTAEIVKRLGITRLSELVDHRKLIVPQLGAPGVSAHRVKELSGFAVVYGPVRAGDIPAFMEAGLKTTHAMRRVHFGTADRANLIAVEVAGGLKILIFSIALVYLAAKFTGLKFPATEITCILGAYIAGTVIGPLLLPWLPGKAFALKGMFAGILVTVPLAASGILTGNIAAFTAGVLFTLSISSFLLMNFTGGIHLHVTFGCSEGNENGRTSSGGCIRYGLPAGSYKHPVHVKRRSCVPYIPEECHNPQA